MRALLIGLLTAAGLALVGLTALYSQVDADDYRADIAAAIESLTGREIRIDGRVEVSLLPRPTVSMTRASLANPAGADGVFNLAADRLDLEVRLWPLLLGELDVHDALLVRPVLTVDRLPVRPLDLLLAPAAAGENPRLRAVHLDQLVVADGMLVVVDGEGEGDGRAERHRIEGINLDLSAEPGGGRLVLAGDFRQGRALFSLAAELGQPDERRTASLQLELAAQGPLGNAASVSFRGLARLDADLPELRGDLRAEGDALQQGVELAGALLSGDAAVAGDAGDDAPATAAASSSGPLDDPFALGGRLELTPGALRLDELTLRLGDGDAAGQFALAFDGPGGEPRLDLTLRAANLELPDPSPEALAIAAWPTPPRGLTGAIDVTADAATARGGTLRRLRLGLTLADGRVTIERAAALLPGGTDVAFTGTFGPTAAGGDAGAPQLSGTLEAGTDNLRALLDWVGVDTSAVPPDRLRTLSFTGNVALTPELIRFSQSDLRFDASTATGSLAAGLGPRRRFAVAATLDRFHADAYLPPIASPAAAAPAAGEAEERPSPLAAGEEPTSVGAPEDTAEGADGVPSAARPWVPQAWRELALGFDAAVDLRVARTTWRGQRLEDVRLRGRLEEGRLTLDELAVADLAELTVDARGGIDLRRETLDVAFTVETDRPERALRLLGYEPPPMVARFAPVRLDGTADGPLIAAAVELEARAGEVELALTGQAGGSGPGAAGLDASWQASHPDLPDLLTRIGLPNVPAAALDGPAQLAGGVKLAPGRAHEVRFAGTFGPMAVDGALSWREDQEPRPSVALHLGAEPLAAEIVIPLLSAGAAGGGPAAFTPGSLSRRPLGAEDLRALDLDLDVTTEDLRHGGRSLGPLVLSAEIEDGTLELRRLETKPFGGDMSLRGRVATEGPLAAVDLNLVLDRVEAGPLLELLGLPAAVRGPADVRLTASTAGRSAYDLVGALDGEMEVRIRDGSLAGVSLAPVRDLLTEAAARQPDDAGQRVRQRFLGGETPFALFGGLLNLQRGVLRAADLGAVLAEGGAGKVEGFVDLLFWVCDLSLSLSPDGGDGLPPVGLRLVGPLGQPQRVPQFQAVEAYLTIEASRAATGAPPPRAPGATEDDPPPRGAVAPLRPIEAPPRPTGTPEPAAPPPSGETPRQPPQAVEPSGSAAPPAPVETPQAADRPEAAGTPPPVGTPEPAEPPQATGAPGPVETPRE